MRNINVPYSQSELLFCCLFSSHHPPLCRAWLSILGDLPIQKQGALLTPEFW